MSCEGYPTASNMKLLATDAQTINEVVTSTADLTTPASDGLPKTTLTGIDNKVADAISNSFSAYIGEWSVGLTFNAPNEYAVFSGVSYKPKSGTVLPYVAQGADPTLSPDVENVEPFSDVNTDTIYSKAGGKVNHISNPQCKIPSPDPLVVPPSATPTDYVPGEQVYSGAFADETVGITGLTDIGGLKNATSGKLYFLVPNTGALESLNDFTASYAGLDLKPKTDGVTFSLDGSNYKIEVDFSIATDVFSVKFETGSVATGHEVDGFSAPLPVNVMGPPFLAKGDGVTDDTDAIQSAINTGRKVFFPKPPVEYMVDAERSLNLLYGSSLIGETLDTRLKVIPNDNKSADLIYVGSDVRYFSIESLTLVGDRYEHLNGIGEHGMGIRMENGCRHGVIKDVTSRDMWGDGFYIGGGDTTAPAEYIEMTNCYSSNNRRQGLSITCGENLFFSNCTFRDTNGTAPECGVDIEPNTIEGVGAQVVNGVVFESCKFIGNTKDGIRIDAHPSQGGSVNNVVVDNCYMYNNGVQGVVALGGANNLKIVNSTIEENGGPGIAFYDSSGLNSGIKISVNQFFYNNRQIYCDLFVEDLQIKGNTFKQANGDTRFLVDLRQPHNCKVIGNKFESSNQGLKLSGVRNASILGNTFESIPYTAIELADSNCEHGALSNNTFIDCGYSLDADDTIGNYSGVPVHLRSGAANWHISDNVYSGDNEPRDAYYATENSSTTGNTILHDRYKWDTVSYLRNIGASGNTVYRLNMLNNQTVSGSALADITANINTRDKVVGVTVYNTSNKQPYWATGSGASATWTNSDGSDIITPV